jgi:tetratricopeptide (TPR) repeat protein
VTGWESRSLPEHLPSRPLRGPRCFPGSGTLAIVSGHRDPGGGGRRRHGDDTRRDRRSPRDEHRRRDRRSPPAEPRPHRARPLLSRDVAEEVRGTARIGRAEEAVGLAEEAAVALAEGDAGRAERSAMKLKALAPRSAAAREVLGLALYHQERFREALRELLAYRRMSGRRDQNHVIADCHRALGAPEKAVAEAREGLASPVDDDVRAECAIVAGAALAELGRFEESLSVLRSVPTRPDVARPHDLRLWYVIADVLERAGRRDEAAVYFRLILRHDLEAFDAAERLSALS